MSTKRLGDESSRTRNPVLEPTHQTTNRSSGPRARSEIETSRLRLREESERAGPDPRGVGCRSGCAPPPRPRQLFSAATAATTALYRVSKRSFATNFFGITPSPRNCGPDVRLLRLDHGGVDRLVRRMRAVGRRQRRRRRQFERVLGALRRLGRVLAPPLLRAGDAGDEVGQRRARLLVLEHVVARHQVGEPRGEPGAGGEDARLLVGEQARQERIRRDGGVRRHRSRTRSGRQAR